MTVADYSDRTTRLTARKYAWDVTLTRAPLRHGRNESHDCTGIYNTQPGATVGSLLAGITSWYAQRESIPANEVVLVRYSLEEK